MFMFSGRSAERLFFISLHIFKVQGLHFFSKSTALQHIKTLQAY